MQIDSDTSISSLSKMMILRINSEVINSIFYDKFIIIFYCIDFSLSFGDSFWYWQLCFSWSYLNSVETHFDRILLCCNGPPGGSAPARSSRPPPRWVGGGVVVVGWGVGVVSARNHRSDSPNVAATISIIFGPQQGQQDGLWAPVWTQYYLWE